MTKEESDGPLIWTELVWEPGVYTAAMYDALCASGRAPDAVFCFNAGIWGYDTWRPTLRMVMLKGAPLVVTSYTFQEAEDDEDVIAEEMVLARLDKNNGNTAGSRPSWAWRAERNPFGSSLEIPSFHAGKVLRENSFWMAVHSP